MEPFGIAVRAVTEAQASGADLLILGAGPIGLLCVAAARALGANRFLWKEKIVIRRYCKDFPVKAPCERNRIHRIPKTEKNAVSPLAFAETPNTKLFTVLETELDHRIQFVAEASFRHIQLNEMRVGHDRRGGFAVQARHSLAPSPRWSPLSPLAEGAVHLIGERL